MSKNNDAIKQNDANYKPKSVIFPMDVYSASRKSSGLQTKNYLDFGVGMLFIICSFVFLAVYYFCHKFLGIGLGLSLIIFLVISITLCVACFRTFIFKEDDKILEYESSNDLDFSRFFNFRKDVINKVNYRGKEVQVFEYLDGAFAFALNVRYGSTNDERAYATKSCFKRLFRVIAQEGFVVHNIEMTEDFETSYEYKNYVDLLNKIDDIDVRKCQLDILETIMDDCRENCSVTCSCFLIQVNSAMQKYNLENSLIKIFECFDISRSSIRSVEVCDFDALKKLICSYYGLDVLDLMAIKQSQIARLGNGYDLGIIRVDSVKLMNNIKLVNKTNEPNSVEDSLNLPIFKIK